MQNNGLRKTLGVVDVFAISVGVMVSSGLFVIPGIAAAQAGPAVILAYFLAAFLVLPSILSMAELSTAMPRAGGSYFFISRSLGTAFGTVDGVGVWLALLLKSGVSLLGLGFYLNAYTQLSPEIMAALCCILFLLINLVGAKETAGLQIAMVFILLGILFLLIVRGLPAVEAFRYQPFAPFGFKAVLPTAGLVFVSFIGVTKIASLSEEVRKPERNIPLGMLLSLLVVATIYILVVTVIVGVVPAAELHGSLTPVSDAARRVIGPAGIHIINIAAGMAFATTANAGILASSRYLVAMGRDRAIPVGLSKLSKRGIPVPALLLTSALIVIVVLATELEQIAKLASTFQLLVFALASTAVIVMRESGIESYDPGFKSPFYPYTQIVGILVAVVLIPEMGLLSSVLAMGLVVTGILWHNLYVRHRVSRVGAVAQMAERVAERLLRRDADALGLNQELRQILKEKGLRPGDPFSQTVRDAEFVENEDASDLEQVFRLGARILAHRSRVSHDLILGALLQRNQLGETPVDAGIALPHLLLDEVEDFHLVAVRSIEGIPASEGKQPIHAVFLLLGSRADPSRHLRILAAIARHAESRDFIHKWNSAASVEELRALLLTEPAADQRTQ
ncbi:amino acid permease [candidate division KSB1 bacterium]|nr:amino acid permease [candidate division KSB1 bacterium]